jgi:heptosyltransferase-2
VLVWEKQQSKYANLLELAQQIRERNYQRVYNCQRFAATGMLTWRSGADFKAGFDKNPFAPFFSRKAVHRIPGKYEQGVAGFQHEVQRNSLLLGEPKTEFHQPRIYPSQEDIGLARRISRDKPIVVMAPGSVWFTKRWPEGKWAELIRQIPDWIRVVLVGSTEEEELGSSLASVRDDVQNLCGQRSLMQSAALMKESLRTFANDSGPAHFAAAVGAPVTAFFLATRPDFGFSPAADDLHLLMADGECCASGIHGSKACEAGDFHCAEIDPAKALEDELPLWSAAKILREGGLLLHDTDTVPGLAARADDPEAVGRIYEVKGREEGKPLLMLCDSIEMVERYVPLPQEVRRIWERTLSIPVTIVLPDARTGGEGGLAPNLLPANGSIGVRIAARARVRTLIRAVGVPIASTSANRSGQPTASKLYEVDPVIKESVDQVLPVVSYPDPALPADFDWNLPLRYRREMPEAQAQSSTILLWTGSGFKILRQGAGFEAIANLVES